MIPCLKKSVKKWGYRSFQIYILRYKLVQNLYLETWTSKLVLQNLYLEICTLKCTLQFVPWNVPQNLYLKMYLEMYLKTCTLQFVPWNLYLKMYLKMYLETYLKMYLETYLKIYLKTYLKMYLKICTLKHTSKHTSKLVPWNVPQNLYLEMFLKMYLQNLYLKKCTSKLVMVKENFPHSYTSPHIHLWIFRTLWVINFLVRVTYKKLNVNCIKIHSIILSVTCHG